MPLLWHPGCETSSVQGGKEQIQFIPLSQVAFEMIGLELRLAQIEFFITSHTPLPIASEKNEDQRSFKGCLAGQNA